MPLVPTADLVASARAENRGVLAFNVITLEHAEGILLGAEAAAQGVILQISQNAAFFRHGGPAPLAAACRLLAESSHVAASLHFDHVEDTGLLHQADSFGFSSVMFDASRLAHDENTHATAEAAQWAHDHGLWIEAELGEIGGKGGAHAPGVRTDPTEAAEFVDATNVDALAVAVGSTHAMTTRDATLDFDLIRNIRARLAVPLVLHGSSGVGSADLRAAVDAGLTKINVGTLLNVAFSATVAEAFRNGDPVDPRKYLGRARDAVAAAVEELLRDVTSTVAGGAD
jgi:fructose-bisphosphate aldolase class II